MNEKILISISGKSGAGKSIFSEHLANLLNGELLNLDKISHLSLQNEEIKSKLLDIFGNEIFDNENNIIRKKMGAIAFSNQEKLNKLNSISQVFMENYIDEIIKNSQKQFIILEYALLTKMKYFQQSKFKILVCADENTRLNRLTKRDNISQEYLKKREQNLPNFNNNDFDVVINNNENSEQSLIEIAKNTVTLLQSKIK